MSPDASLLILMILIRIKKPRFTKQTHSHLPQQGLWKLWKWGVTVGERLKARYRGLAGVHGLMNRHIVSH